jgi:hypothetical protein
MNTARTVLTLNLSLHDAVKQVAELYEEFKERQREAPNEIAFVYCTALEEMSNRLCHEQFGYKDLKPIEEVISRLLSQNNTVIFYAVPKFKRQAHEHKDVWSLRFRPSTDELAPTELVLDLCAGEIPHVHSVYQEFVEMLEQIGPIPGESQDESDKGGLYRMTPSGRDGNYSTGDWRQLFESIQQQRIVNPNYEEIGRAYGRSGNHVKKLWNRFCNGEL